MKIYRGIVRLNKRRNTASHFISVEKDSLGRSIFHFSRIVHNLNDHEEFPIHEMNPAFFKEQLRSMDRAYSVSIINDEETIEFIDKMLKIAYPDSEEIIIEEIKTTS